MYITKLAALLSLATSALSLPTGEVQKRALTVRPYTEFQISSGTAGNALAEAQAKFPIDTKNLASTAEAAETDAFNDEVDSASGTAAAALQIGKIKNKVLKLYLETTALQIQQAQGGKDNQAKIDKEQKKLNNNVAADKKAAGQASQSVKFTGDVKPKN
ncbi:hypothetical protein PG990_005611 [Apiospora arundinis]